MSISVQDRIVFISGANRGIGKAITEAVLAAGAQKVYAAVRTLDSAQPLIDAHGDRVVAVQLDITDAASVEQAAEHANDVDIVINNAGVLRTSTPLAEDTFDSLEFEFDVNVKGLLRVARAFVPVLAKSQQAALVQLNSVASLKAFASFSTYSASKAAAYSLTQSLRDSLAEQHIHVQSVHPGPIATDMADSAGFESETAPSVVADAILAGLKSGQFHVFPDPLAEQVWGAYQSFATHIVEADLSA